MTRATPPQWSFADLEFRAQNIALDPLLQQISDFIDQHQTLVEHVRQDLQRGLKKPATGRNGLDAPQVLRSLTLMRVKNWDYRELRERIADGYTLRQFTQFFSSPVPQHDAFHRAFVRLTPATLEAVNQQIVQAAVALGLEDGKKLRTDTTVVETDIHHPTDSTANGWWPMHAECSSKPNTPGGKLRSTTWPSRRYAKKSSPTASWVTASSIRLAAACWKPSRSPVTRKSTRSLKPTPT